MIEDTRYSSPNTHAHEGFSECAITRGNWGIIVSPPLPTPPHPSRRTRARVERVGELEKVFEINASRYTSFVFSRGGRTRRKITLAAFPRTYARVCA